MIQALAAAAAVLLAAAGAGKLRSPAPAVAMLVNGWPALRRRRAALTHAVRAGGIAELAVAVAVLADGGRAAHALLALAYLVFVGVVLGLLTRGRGTSCGCFGAAESPVGAAHLVVDVAATAVAALAAARPPGPLAGLTDQPAATVVTGLGQVCLLAGLAYLSITALPATAAARRHVEESA